MNAARHTGNSSRPSDDQARGPAPGETRDDPTGQSSDAPSSSPSPDLLAALTGREAGRDRAVAHRTRRVVMSSLGIMREQKEDRSRARGVALGVTVLVLLLIAPLLWEATDSLIAGEHPGDPGSELSLWAGVVCCTLLAAAVVAGWWKNRA